MSAYQLPIKLHILPILNSKINNSNGTIVMDIHHLITIFLPLKSIKFSTYITIIKFSTDITIIIIMGIFPKLYELTLPLKSINLTTEIISIYVFLNITHS